MHTPRRNKRRRRRRGGRGGALVVAEQRRDPHRICADARTRSGLSRSALGCFAPIAPPAPLRHPPLALLTVSRSHSAKRSCFQASTTLTRRAGLSPALLQLLRANAGPALHVRLGRADVAHSDKCLVSSGLEPLCGVLPLRVVLKQGGCSKPRDLRYALAEADASFN